MKATRMPMIRLLAATALLAVAGAAVAQPHAPWRVDPVRRGQSRPMQPAVPPVATGPREVWVADEAPGTPQRSLTLALRDALAAAPAVPARRHRRVPTPPVVPSAPAPAIIYLADDVRIDRGHRHFRYTALLTDRGFRTTTPIAGRCRVDQVAACARGIVARLPA